MLRRHQHSFWTRIERGVILALLLTFGAPALADSAHKNNRLIFPEGHAVTVLQERRAALLPRHERKGGQNNSVRVVQTGDNNRSLIRQDGNNNAVNLQQHGGNNAQVIIQLGDGSSANVTQTGNQSGVLLQFGH